VALLRVRCACCVEGGVEGMKKAHLWALAGGRGGHFLGSCLRHEVDSERRLSSELRSEVDSEQWTVSFSVLRTGYYSFREARKELGREGGRKSSGIRGLVGCLRG
jgi:hypothetical protein